MYQSIPAVAQNLGIPEGLIETFMSHGWISAVQKDGLTFLARHQQYRIRFIQHLRDRLQLSDEQVAIVLQYEQPPYSLEQVESILQEHSAATQQHQC
jgi:hypothetical protein